MTTSRKKAAPTSGAKTNTTQRASKARFDQGLSLIRERTESPSQWSRIAEFQYPSGATDAEKLAMAEKLIRLIDEGSNRKVAGMAVEVEKHRHLKAMYRRQLDSALVMIREFGIIPRDAGDFGDGIPF